MKALISLCFLALALVCQATPRHLTSLEGVLQNRRLQTNLLQALNDYPLLSSLELQQLRRLLSSVDVDGRKNAQYPDIDLGSVNVDSHNVKTPEVHTRPNGFGLG